MELTVFKIGFLREGNPLQEAADSAVTKHVSLLKKMIRKKKMWMELQLMVLNGGLLKQMCAPVKRYCVCVLNNDYYKDMHRSGSG